jgi:hypothetical protein
MQHLSFSSTSADWIRTLQRAALAALMLTAACHGGAGTGGTTGGTGGGGGPPPPDCSAGCPPGYTCSEGVCTGGDAQKLAFDVKTFPVSGRITVDGKAPTATSSSCSSDQVAIDFIDAPPQVHFWDPILGTSARASVACASSDGTFSARLPAGTYRVLASQYESATTFPPATFTVQSGFVVAAPVADLKWDLTTVPVSGKLTVDGKAPVKTSSSCSSTQVRLTLLDDSGASFDVDIDCATSDGSFSARVAPGTYRVLASQYESATTFPAATFVVQPSFTVTSAKSGLKWDLTTVPVSGKLTVDGQPPVKTSSSCSSTQVRLTLLDDSGASFDADIDCATSDGSFSARVAPGTYRVLASQYESATTFPAATFVVQPSFAVTGAKTGLKWDLTTVPISGKLTVDGQPPMKTSSSCSSTQVRLTLVGDAGASFDADIDCATSDGSFSARVAPGTYRVIASQYESATTFPAATFTVAPAFVVTGAKTGLAWKLQTVPVAGTLKVDGMAPMKTSSSCSSTQVRISLHDASGASFDADIDCATSDGSFSARVAPGTYRLVASQYESATTFPSATFNLQDAVAIP